MTRAAFLPRLLVATLAAAALAACGAGGLGADESGAFFPPGGDGAGADTSSPGGAQEPDVFVPEDERDIGLEAPQGSDRFVYLASRGLDAVVRIDAKTLRVDLLEVGGEPTLLRTLPGTDSLVVFNQGTRDFTVLRASSLPGGAPQPATLDAPSWVNRLVVAPGGAHALAWYDPDAAGTGDPVGDLQAVLALDLTPGAEALHPVSVGFHPRTATFVSGGKKAWIVTDDGLSPIDLDALAGPAFVPTVPVTDDSLEPAFDREVLVTPDGKRAVVRRGGVAELRVLDLATGEAEVLPLAAAPTDVDLTRTGAEAIVVVREAAQVLRVPLADPSAAQTLDLGERPAGLATLTPDGSRAILFTTLPGQEWVGVLDLGTGALSVHAVQKRIAAVIPAPDGETAVLLHAKEPGTPDPSGDLATFIDRSHGYSVLDVATGFAKLQLLDFEPLSVLATDDGLRAFVLVPDPAGAASAVDDVDLRSLLVTPRPLASKPTHALFVPAAERVAISQEHPVGRITFVSTADGSTETVTGFELNGLIR